MLISDQSMARSSRRRKFFLQIAVYVSNPNKLPAVLKCCGDLFWLTDTLEAT